MLDDGAIQQRLGSFNAMILNLQLISNKLGLLITKSSHYALLLNSSLSFCKDLVVETHKQGYGLDISLQASSPLKKIVTIVL